MWKKSEPGHAAEAPERGHLSAAKIPQSLFLQHRSPLDHLFTNPMKYGPQDTTIFYLLDLVPGSCSPLQGTWVMYTLLQKYLIV